MKAIIRKMAHGRKFLDDGKMKGIN